MAERKRNKEIHFYVTEEERKLIRRKMIESKTKNMGAYLRKMARNQVQCVSSVLIVSSGNASCKPDLSPPLTNDFSHSL